jgi:hypothetical protein
VAGPRETRTGRTPKPEPAGQRGQNRPDSGPKWQDRGARTGRTAVRSGRTPRPEPAGQRGPKWQDRGARFVFRHAATAAQSLGQLAPSKRTRRSGVLFIPFYVGGLAAADSGEASVSMKTASRRHEKGHFQRKWVDRGGRADRNRGANQPIPDAGQFAADGTGPKRCRSRFGEASNAKAPRSHMCKYPICSIINSALRPRRAP